MWYYGKEIVQNTEVLLMKVNEEDFRQKVAKITLHTCSNVNRKAFNNK